MSTPLVDFIAGQRHRPTLLALLLLGAGLAIAAWGGVLSGQGLIARQQAEALAQREAGSKGSGASAARDVAPVDPRVLNAARTLAGQLATPWSDLLALLEANPVKDVALTGLEPNSERAEMRITGDARSLEHVVQYLRFLQKQPRVARAVLVQHQIQANEPGTPVRFQVQVNWRTS